MAAPIEKKRTSGNRKGGDHWRNLEIWKISDRLAQDIYKETKDFPPAEIFGLTSQIRRAALSIPTNIVEGCARKGDRELARFISIALGSLAELKYLLHFSSQIGYLKPGQNESLSLTVEFLGAKLWRFYETISKKKP